MIAMKQTLSTFLALIVLTSLQPASVSAGTQTEYEALKQWCVGRDKWTAAGRKTDYPNPNEYFHFHHYCGALNAMDRLYLTFSPIKQRHEAGQVMSETQYVIGHVPENHFLMPEVYALRGRALLLIKQNSKAEESLNKALRLDPRYAEVYANLGNLYLNTNRKAKATEVTQTGLTIDPQHRALRRLAGKLGIKLEEPKAESEKIQASPSPTEIKPSDSARLLQDIKPVSPPPSLASDETEPPKQIVDKTTEVAGSKSSNTDALPTNIGTPRNPWCRFCPDTPTKADPLPSKP